MNQTALPSVTIAVDFGASLARAIYTINKDDISPKIIFLEPEILEVPKESIENYQKNRQNTGREEDTAWLKLGEVYYAVGFLAKNRFNTLKSLNTLKLDAAIPLILSMLGAIAQKQELGNKFKVTMGILLPWSELKDKDRFHQVIIEAMKSFTFRGEEYSLELELFTALPEGGGLLAKARAPKPNQQLQPVKAVNLAVLMIGYRNSSLLVLEKGELVKGITSDFGFSKMIHRVIELTSGQTEERLIEAVCAIGSKKKPDKRILDRLVRTTRTELKQAEIESLQSAIIDARKEYVVMLTNWIKKEIPFIKINEFLIGGGTARYLKTEIVETLHIYGAQLNWGETLEHRIQQTFGNEVNNDELAARLTDVYGLFYKLLSVPLPRRQAIEDDINSQTNKQKKLESKEVSNV